MGPIDTVRAWYRPVPTRRPWFSKKNATPEDGIYGNASSDVLPSRASGNGSIASGKDGAVAARPRYYCNGRMTRRQFICAQIAVGLFVLTLIMGPVMYFAVVPAIIRAKVRNLPLESLNIQAMHVQSWHDDGMAFNFKASLPEQFPIGVRAKIVPRDVQVQTSPKTWEDASSLMSMGSSPIEFNLKNPEVTMDGRLTVAKTDNLRDLVKEFSSDNGLAARTLYARMRVDIAVFGITFYRNFEVEKPLEIPAVKPDLLAVWNTMPNWIKSEVERKRQSKSIADALKYESVALGGGEGATISIVPELPPITLRDLEVADGEKGPEVTLKIALNNPTVATFDSIPPVAFPFVLEGEELATVRVEGVKLQNGKSEMTLKVNMDISEKARDRLPRAMYRTVAKILGGTGNISVEGNETVDVSKPLEAALAGPISLKGVSFTERVTVPLKLRLPIEEAGKAVGLGRVRDMFTPIGVSLLMKYAHFDVSVDSTSVQVPLSVKIPAIIPLPPKPLVVPFTFDMAIGYKSSPTLKLRIRDLRLVPVDDGHAFAVMTHATMTPINTDKAAEAMGAFTDAVLVRGETTRLEISELSLMGKGDVALGWADRLLKGLTVKAPIPAIDIMPVIAVFTDNGVRIPVAVRSLLLHQKDPGFQAGFSGDITIPNPDAGGADMPFRIPEISTNIGYVAMAVDYDGDELVSLSMPNGVQLKKGTVEGLAADVAFPSKDVASKGLMPKVQGLVDAMLSGKDWPGSVVMRGIEFGPDSKAVFKTFSRIKIPLPLEKLRPIGENMVRRLKDAVVANPTGPIVKVHHADVVIDSTTKVKAELSLVNPFPLDLAIGSTNLDFAVNSGANILSVKVSPISMKPDENRLPLEVDISFHNDQTSEEPLGQLIEGVWKKVLVGSRIETQHAIAASGLVLEASNKFDSFAGLRIGLPVQPLVEASAPMLSLVDLSAIMPSSLSDFIGQTKTKIQSADVDTKEKKSLELRPEVGLNNPLAISLSMTSTRLGVHLGQGFLCNVEVANFTLARGQGRQIVAPTISFQFEGSTNEAADALAEAVDGLLSRWRIPVSASVNQVQFGSKDVVTLMSKANLVLPLAALPIESVARPILDEIIGSLPTLNEIMSGTSSLDPKLKAIKLKTQPGSILEGRMSAELNNPLPFSAKVGWMKVDLTLNDAPLGTVTLAAFDIGRGQTPLNLEFQFRAANGHDVQIGVADIVRDFLAGYELKQRIGIANLRMGHNSDDHIAAFEKVRAALAINKVLRGGHSPMDVAAIAGDSLRSVIHGIGGASEGTAAIVVPIMKGFEIKVSAVHVGMQSGAKMRVEAGIDLGAEVDVDIVFGYFSTSVSVDGSTLVTVQMRDATIKNKVDSRFALDLAFSQEEEAQNKVAAVVNSLWDNKATGALTVGQALLGNSDSDVIALLGEVRVDLSLQSLAQPIMDTVHSAVNSITERIRSAKDLLTIEKETLQISLGAGLAVTLNEAQVATLPKRVLELSVQASVRHPFHFLSVAIPYVTATVGVNGAPLGAVSISGLNMEGGSGEKKLALTIGVQFSDSDEIALQVSGLANRVLKGESLQGTNILVAGPRIGVNPTDMVNTFSKVQLQMDAGVADGVVNTTHGLVSGALDGSRQIYNVTSRGKDGWSVSALDDKIGVDILSLEVSTRPSASLEINVDAGLRLPFKLALDIKYVTMAVDINGEKLAIVETSIAINDGKLDKVRASLSFGGASEKVEGELAAFVSEILERRQIHARAGISGIALGVSRDDCIRSLRDVRVDTPVGLLMHPVLGMLPDKLDPVDLLEKLGFRLRGVAAKTLPGGKLAVELRVDLKNPVPISAHFGYVSAFLGTRGTPLVSAGLNDVHLNAAADNSLTLATELTFNSDAAAQDALAELIRDPKTISASGMQFGHDVKDVVTTFRKVEVTAGLSGLISNRTMEFALKQIGLKRDDLDVEALLRRVNFDQFDVVMGSTIDLDLAMLVSLPITPALDIDVPVIALIAYAYGHPLTGIQVSGMQLKSLDGGSINMRIKAQLDMAASEEAQQHMVRLVNEILAGSTKFQVTGGVGSIMFGHSSSSEDMVLLASKLRLDLDMSPIANQMRRLLPERLDVVEVAQKMGLQLGGVKVRAEKGAKMAVDAQIGFNATLLPCNLTIGYAAVTVGVGNGEAPQDLVTMEVRDISVRGGQQNLQMALHAAAQFHNSDPAQIALAEFMRQPTSFSLSGLRFGASESRHIRLFAKTRLTAPANMVMNGKVFDYALAQLKLTRGDLTLENLAERLDITALDVHVSKTTTVKMEASVALPVDIEVNLPFAAATAYLEGAQLARATVQQVRVNTHDGRVHVACNVAVDLGEGEDVKTKVAELVSRLVAGGDKDKDAIVPLTVGFDGLEFGIADDSAARTLRRVRIDQDVTPIVTKARKGVLEYVHKVMDWLKIDDINVEMLPKGIMGATVAVDIGKLPLINRVTMKLDLAALEMYINDVHAANPRVTGLELIKGKMVVKTAVAFESSEQAIATLGDLSNQFGRILFKLSFQSKAVKVGVRNIRFGSGDKLVDLVSKVDVSLDIAEYVVMIKKWYDEHTPFTIEDTDSLIVPEGVHNHVKISNRLPIPLRVNIPSATARVYYEGFGDTVMVNAYALNMIVRDGMIDFDLHLAPEFPTVMQAFKTVVPDILSWKDFSSKAKLGGYLVHSVPDPRTAKPEDTLSAFVGTRMQCPPLYMWSPVNVRPILINPFKEGMGMDMEIDFHNPGPLRVNVGNVKFGLFNSVRNAGIGHMEMQGLTLENAKTRAPKGINILRFKMRLTLKLFSVPGLLVDLVAHRDRFGYKCDIRNPQRPDEVMTVPNQIMEQLPPDLMANMWSIVVGLLKNASVRIFKPAVDANSVVIGDGKENATASASDSALSSLSRRWLTRRAADEAEARKEIARWESIPLVPENLADKFIIDWSALKVVNE